MDDIAFRSTIFSHLMTALYSDQIYTRANKVLKKVQQRDKIVFTKLINARDRSVIDLAGY